jgi:hypothetical protein
VAAVVLVALLGGLALLVGLTDDAGTTPASSASATSPPGGLDVAGPASESPAVVAATAVLQAWSRPGLAYPWWWRGLEPLLSPGARAAYAHTDPEQLPTLGDLSVVEEQDGGATATVWFRTEAGRFGVDLARGGADEEWLAHRILFPGQESMFG